MFVYALQDLNDVELCYLDYVNALMDSTDSSESGVTKLAFSRMGALIVGNTVKTEYQ